MNPDKQIPDEVNVIFEIRAHSNPVKYQVDMETGAMCIEHYQLARKNPAARAKNK